MFLKGSKSAGKNIEVTMDVVSDRGQILPVRLDLLNQMRKFCHFEHCL